MQCGVQGEQSCRKDDIFDTQDGNGDRGMITMMMTSVITMSNAKNDRALDAVDDGCGDDEGNCDDDVSCNSNNFFQTQVHADTDGHEYVDVCSDQCDDDVVDSAGRVPAAHAVANVRQKARAQCSTLNACNEAVTNHQPGTRSCNIVVALDEAKGSGPGRGRLGVPWAIGPGLAMDGAVFLWFAPGLIESGVVGWRVYHGPLHALKTQCYRSPLCRPLSPSTSGSPRFLLLQTR